MQNTAETVGRYRRSRSDGQTVQRRRDRAPDIDQNSVDRIPRYISRPIPPERSTAAPTYRPPEQLPAEIQRPANTAGAVPPTTTPTTTAPGIHGRNQPQKPDRARWIFRARYGVGDDLRSGAARAPPELSRSALSAISKFRIARCEPSQLSALISANCTKLLFVAIHENSKNRVSALISTVTRFC